MNNVQKTTLHPVGDDNTDLYPKTSTDQIIDLVEFLNNQGLNPKPFVVGNVTTLPADGQAQVTFTETNDKIAINFAIPQGDIGAQGNAGPEGLQGPVGPRGPSGNDFQIKLQVDSATDLPTASSAYLGWAAYVGTESPRDVYACVEIADGVIAWENQGKLQGAKGENGNSVEGFTLVKHEVVGNETYNTIQVHYSDLSANTFEIHAMNGTNGRDGTDGVVGNIIVVQATTPSGTYNNGDIWINNNTFTLYQYRSSDSQWINKGSFAPTYYEHNIEVSFDGSNEKYFITAKIITKSRVIFTITDFINVIIGDKFITCGGKFKYTSSSNKNDIYMVSARQSSVDLYNITFRCALNDTPSLSDIIVVYSTEQLNTLTIRDWVRTIKL